MRIKYNSFVCMHLQQMEEEYLGGIQMRSIRNYLYCLLCRRSRIAVQKKVVEYRSMISISSKNTLEAYLNFMISTRTRPE